MPTIGDIVLYKLSDGDPSKNGSRIRPALVVHEQSAGVLDLYVFGPEAAKHIQGARQVTTADDGAGWMPRSEDAE